MSVCLCLASPPSMRTSSRAGASWDEDRNTMSDESCPGQLWALGMMCSCITHHLASCMHMHDARGCVVHVCAHVHLCTYGSSTSSETSSAMWVSLRPSTFRGIRGGPSSALTSNAPCPRLGTAVHTTACLLKRWLCFWWPDQVCDDGRWRPGLCWRPGL